MNDIIIKQAHPRIPREFWEALLNIHNNFFDCVLTTSHERPDSKQFEHVLRSFRTLDCWLDLAKEEGWLD
jgi:hypothetical protein